MATTKVETEFSFALKGERQVERALDGLIRRIGSASSGADIATLALEKFARVFRVGLPVALGATAIAVGIEKIYEFGKEANKVADETNNLTFFNFANASPKVLEGRLEEIKAKMKELAPEVSHGFWETFAKGSKDAFYSGLNFIAPDQGFSEMTAKGESRNQLIDAQRKAMQEKAARDEEESMKLLDRSGGSYINTAGEMEDLKIKNAKKRRLATLERQINRESELQGNYREDIALLNDPRYNDFKSKTERTKEEIEITEKIVESKKKQAEAQTAITDMYLEQRRAVAGGLHVESLQRLGGLGRRTANYSLFGGNQLFAAQGMHGPGTGDNTAGKLDKTNQLLQGLHYVMTPARAQ